MSTKINLNRYRLITLLYVVFVCLTVLNIPSSLLDSYHYSIKTIEYQINKTMEQVEFANKVIQDKQIKLSASDSAKVFLDIQNRIHESFIRMREYDQKLQNFLRLKGSDVDREFNTRRFSESFYLQDSGIYRVREDLQELVRYIQSQPYQIDQAIAELVPMRDTIINASGNEKDWANYLFLHKPTAISYFHIKRIQQILLQNEIIYQNAALKTIGYQTAYYSEKVRDAIIFQPNTNTTKNIEQQELIDTMKKIPSPSPQPPPVKVPTPPPVKVDSTSKTVVTEKMNDFVQRIISSLHAETFYVGIPNEVLKEFNYLLGVDFDFEIIPKAEIQYQKNTYFIRFPKAGQYVFRFTEKNKSGKKISFEKKVTAYLIPSPQVKLNGDGNNFYRELASVRDLFTANRLVGYIQVYDIKNFPGRINSFYVTRIGREDDRLVTERKLNYGDVFSPEIQSLLRKLKKGDFLMIDNIQINMADGTTRNASPLTYKIIE
jgi:hypothetical protein